MKRAVFSLLIFVILIGGGSFLYTKWHFFQEDTATFVHDKPITCSKCGDLLWHGGKAHSCDD
ncbi:MAG: hypothetical protein AB7N99_02320 [Simkaniaceae bacterium]